MISFNKKYINCNIKHKLFKQQLKEIIRFDKQATQLYALYKKLFLNMG